MREAHPRGESAAGAAGGSICGRTGHAPYGSPLVDLLQVVGCTPLELWYCPHCLELVGIWGAEREPHELL